MHHSWQRRGARGQGAFGCPGSQRQPPAVPTHPAHGLLHSGQRCYGELGVRCCPGRELLEGKAETVREEELATATPALLNSHGQGSSPAELWFSARLKQPLVRGVKAWAGRAARAAVQSFPLSHTSPATPQRVPPDRAGAAGPFWKIHRERDLSCGVSVGLLGALSRLVLKSCQDGHELRGCPLLLRETCPAAAFPLALCTSSRSS